MIVDTSAIIAIVFGESEKDLFLSQLAVAEHPRMSAGSWIELEIVAIRRGTPAIAYEIETLFQTFGIGIEAVSREQARIGREAYRRFGRGIGHRADLNFGDCFAYALAKETGEPLLFKGDDFTHTDVIAAIR